MHNKFKKKLLRFIGNKVLVPLVNVLCKTLRIVETNKPPLFKRPDGRKNLLFAFWHGTMLVPWYAIRELNPSAIISQSKDGELLAKLLNDWRYDLKRGSSSRNGKEVLEELVTNAKNDMSIAITPDGPRGPEREMKAGAVVISKKAQIPIVLIGVSYCWKIKMNSWDKFEIPFFFSKVNLLYCDPILVEAHISYEETGKIMEKLEVKLNDIQIDAEKMC